MVTAVSMSLSSVSVVLSSLMLNLYVKPSFDATGSYSLTVPNINSLSIDVKQTLAQAKNTIMEILDSTQEALLPHQYSRLEEQS
jgi:hypothetical protein